MRIVTDTASLFAPGEIQDGGLFVWHGIDWRIQPPVFLQL
jgi:hypothetical protein